MKTIWKFKIETTDNQLVKMPVGSEILTVQTQFDQPFIWALVNPEEQAKENVYIDIFGTGHPIPDGERKYIGSYQLNDGSFVFHCFQSLV